MILRCGGRFYKVPKLRSKGDNSYTFECKDLDTKENREFQFRMSGLLEAADRAFSVMKSPKDIFFLDLDSNGKWKIVNGDQFRKLLRWGVLQAVFWREHDFE
jgi:hypothetical protein